MRVTKLPLKAWSTLIPDELNILDAIEPIDKNDKLETVSQKQVKAVNDATWLSMNEAGLNMLKQTVANQNIKEVIEPLQTLQKEEKQQIVKEVHQKKTNKKGKRMLKKDEATPVNTREPKQIKHAVVAPLTKLNHFQIATIEEHNQRDNEFELFKAKMPINKNTSNLLVPAPPLNRDKALAYCAKYRHETLWYNSMNKFISNTEYSYPDVCILSRKVLITFLFEPTKDERPCINPITDVHAGVNFRCVAHRLSESKLGKGLG
jgi:hypothetical protein